MIDFYRKSVLSQLGKNAGNQNILDYIRNISVKYEEYLSQMKKEKSKPVKKVEDYGLYL